jgi:uracil phosphoribosyltransferase
MCEGMLDLIPTATVHHIGMYRSKLSKLPVQYYNRLPRDQPCDIAYVVDPCIATSNTIHAVVSILKRWGAKKVIVISAIGARAGITRLLNDHPDIEIHVGAVDETLSENGIIIPGIGDAGDRQFGTPLEDSPGVLEPVLDDETFVQQSKKAKK